MIPPPWCHSGARTDGILLRASHPGRPRSHDTGHTLTWNRARCLKYTADDIARAPHAATCHIDRSTGPPGIKAFRTVALRAVGDGAWTALPGLRDASAGTMFTAPREALPDDARQIIALVCAEPWAATEWHVGGGHTGRRR